MAIARGQLTSDRQWINGARHLIQLGNLSKSERPGVRYLRYAFWDMAHHRCSTFSLDRKDGTESNCLVVLWKRATVGHRTDPSTEYVKCKEHDPVELTDYDLVLTEMLDVLSPSFQVPSPEVPSGIRIMTTVAVSEHIIDLAIFRESERLFVSASLADDDMGQLKVPLPNLAPKAKQGSWIRCIWNRGTQ